MTQDLPPADPMASYIVHLWRRKWWIVIATVVAFAAATFAMRFKNGAAYTASANLFVKPKQFDVGVEGQSLTPVAYKTLMLSDELLNDVRDEAAKLLGFNEGKDVELFESFAGCFQVEIETEADTTVRKDYSPVMTAQFTWPNRVDSQRFLDVWLRKFIEKFGSIQANHAAVLAATAQEQFDKTRTRLESLEDERSQVEAELTTRRNTLYAKQYLLAPVAVIAPQEIEANLVPVRAAQQSVSVETATAPPAAFPSTGQGLLSKAMDLKIEIAKTADAQLQAGQQRELAAAEEAVQGLEREIADLQKQTADLDKRRSVLVADIGAAKAELQVYSGNLAHFALGLKSSVIEKDSPYEGAEVRVVARPVLHDTGAGINKRLMITAATVAVFVFSLLFFIAEKYLRDALAAEK